MLSISKTGNVKDIVVTNDKVCCVCQRLIAQGADNHYNVHHHPAQVWHEKELYRYDVERDYFVPTILETTYFDKNAIRRSV